MTCTTSTPADQCTATHAGDCPVHRQLIGYPGAPELESLRGQAEWLSQKPIILGAARFRISIPATRRARWLRWWLDGLGGIAADWRCWRAGGSTWWQALWGHNVEPWWKVPGFMRRFR